jgi:DNA-binding NarL/FixJ family response regulator
MEVRPLPVLAGRKVLIVEDNFLEAENIRQVVESAGGSVVGPAASIEIALLLADTESPDAALVNVAVNGRTSTWIAKRLTELQIPFVVVTGFSRDVIPPSFRDAGYVAKPFLREALVSALVEAMGLKLL